MMFKKFKQILAFTLTLTLLLGLVPAIHAAEECQHPNMVVDEKAPTCMESGYRSWHCPDCDESGYETFERDPNAHEVGRSVVLPLDEPTCSFPGSEQHITYCSLCNGEISNVIQEIPMVSHSYENGMCIWCKALEGGMKLHLLDGISDGIMVALYSVAGDCAISLNESDGNILPSQTSVDGNTLTTADDTAVLIVYDMGNETFIFEGLDYRTIATNENGTSLHYSGWDDYPLWYLEPVNGQPNTFTIINYDTADKMALAYADGVFTILPLADGEAFYFRFYGGESVCMHEWVLDYVVEEPTCSTEGSAHYHCELCGEEMFKALETTDHSWNEGVETPAGCITVGCTTYTCTVCGQEHNVITPALGHNYQITKEEAASCTSDGYIVYTCANCKHSYTEKSVSATGHNWTEATCTAAPYCTVCHATGGIYTLMENAQDLYDAIEIVIVANVDGVYKALGTTVDSAIEGIDVTVANGMVTGEKLPVWTARLAPNGGYALTCGNEYLMHGGTNTSFYDTPDAFGWTFANTENGMKIYSGDRAIMYRTGTVNAFRAYALSNLGKSSYYGELLVFKYEAGATLSHVDEDRDGLCELCGNPLNADAWLMNRSISLNGNIGLNFYMNLSEEVAADENAYMLFTQEGKEPVKVYVSEATQKVVNGTNAYAFTYEVAAMQMTDEVKAQLFCDNGCTAEYTYSVKAYADAARANLTNDVALLNLLDAMLRYGAASQLQFNYHTERLADAGLEPVDYSAIFIDVPFSDRPVGTKLVSFAGTSMLLESCTTLRFFFRTDAPADSFTVTYEGEPLTIYSRSGLYYVDIDNICAQNLDMDYTIVLDDGTETAELTYCPLTYCATAKQDSYSAYPALQNVATALYLYNQAANAFFTPAE